MVRFKPTKVGEEGFFNFAGFSIISLTLLFRALHVSQPTVEILLNRPTESFNCKTMSNLASQGLYSPGRGKTLVTAGHVTNLHFIA